MAKVSYTKLKKKVEPEVSIVEFNGEKIEVRQWIPTQDRLALMGRVIELAHDENYHFINPIHLVVFTALEVIKAYTNITFTEKQEEDIPKLYDEIVCSGLWEAVREALPEEALNMDWQIHHVAEEYYKYQNSMPGVMENIKLNYDTKDMDIDNLINKIKDPESFGMIKEIINTLG
jgi:hypothetical protein